MFENVSVLIIDQDRSSYGKMKDLLENVPQTRYIIESATNLREAINRVMCGGINIVILSLDLPDSSGIETVVSFSEQISDLPIVIIDKKYSNEFILALLRAGAQEIIDIATGTAEIIEKVIQVAFTRKELIYTFESEKKVAQSAAWYEYEIKEQIEREVEMRKIAEQKLKETIELLSTTNKSLENTNREMKELNSRLEKKEKQLIESNKKLERLAATDPLTGLLNRRAGYACIHQEISRVNRKLEEFGIIMFDIDHFKNYNDIYGHEAGDAMLVKVAEICRNQSRQYDSIVRWGGEEFLIVVPCITGDDLLKKAQRLRTTIESTLIQFDSTTSVTITASFGVSIYSSKNILTIDELIKTADKAMYTAKETGRNRVCTAV